MAGCASGCGAGAIRVQRSFNVDDLGADSNEMAYDARMGAAIGVRSA